MRPRRGGERARGERASPPLRETLFFPACRAIAAMAGTAVRRGERRRRAETWRILRRSGVASRSFRFRRARARVASPTGAGFTARDERTFLRDRRLGQCARRSRHGRSRAPNVEADHPASSPSQQNMSGEGGFNDEAYDSGMQAMCVPVLARPPSAIPGLLRSRAVRFLGDAVGSNLSASNRRPSRLRLTRAFRAPFLASSAALRFR